MIRAQSLHFLYRGQVSIKVSFQVILVNDLSTVLPSVYYLREGESGEWGLVKVWQSLRICPSSH